MSGPVNGWLRDGQLETVLQRTKYLNRVTLESAVRRDMSLQESREELERVHAEVFDDAFMTALGIHGILVVYLFPPKPAGRLAVQFLGCWTSDVRQALVERVQGVNQSFSSIESLAGHFYPYLLDRVARDESFTVEYGRCVIDTGYTLVLPEGTRSVAGREEVSINVDYASNRFTVVCPMPTRSGYIGQVHAVFSEEPSMSIRERMKMSTDSHDVSQIVDMLNLVCSALAGVHTAGLLEQQDLEIGALLESRQAFQGLVSSAILLSSGLKHPMLADVDHLTAAVENLEKGLSPILRRLLRIPDATLDKVKNCAMRVRRSVEGLINMAMGTGTSPGPVDLSAIILDVIALLRLDSERPGAAVARLDYSPEAPRVVRVVETEMRFALYVLLENAKEAVAEVERENVWVGVSPTDGGLSLIIEDEGPGVPERDRLRIFDLFYSTKGDRRGGSHLGLGLAMVQHVVQRLGGNIDVGESQYGGAKFSLTLPAATLCREEGEEVS